MNLRKGSAVIEHILAFLRGGTSSFNQPELLILNSVIDSLPEQEAEILNKQIQSVCLVQRNNPGRLVAAYYSKSANIPVLPYSGYEYCLAKVSYKLDGKTKTTNVVLHNGKFMTFERNVPQKNDHIDSIINVALHPNDYKPVTPEIDAEEHGGKS